MGQIGEEHWAGGPLSPPGVGGGKGKKARACWCNAL